ncbi:hypothetical protein D9M71_613190 [compost metagenome]
MPALWRLPGQRQRLPPGRTCLFQLPQLVMHFTPRRMCQVIVQQFSPRQNPFDCPQTSLRPIPLRQRHRPVQLYHR